MDTPKQELRVSIGMTKEAVIQALGKPVKESVTTDGLTILQYRSSSITLADFVYLKNNGVVLVLTSLYKKDITLEKYLNELGTPTKSYKLNPVTATDNRVIHLWLTKGMSVTSDGLQYYSPVQKVERFQSMTLEEYKESWGKDLKEESVTQVATTKSIVVTLTPSPQNLTTVFNKIELPSSVFLYGAGIVASCVVTMVFVILLRRRKRL